MLVGRCLLQDQDWVELINKYAEHLVNTKQPRVSSQISNITSSGHGCFFSQAAVLTFITGGLYSQAVRCLLTAEMTDTAFRLLTFLERNQLEVEPDLRQEVLAQSARLMEEINYQQGLDNVRQQMGDSGSGEEAGGVKEEV